MQAQRCVHQALAARLQALAARPTTQPACVGARWLSSSQRRPSSRGPRDAAAAATTAGPSRSTPAVPQAAPSLHGNTTRERTLALQEMLAEARRSGTSIRVPSMLDFTKKPRAPQPPPAAAQPTNPASTAAFSPASPAAPASSSSTPPVAPLHRPAAILTGSSISDRRTQTHIDDLADTMAQQLSIVQPEDPHIANLVILGTPNAGKSTLVNHLVGQKISAVSHKRNTTRTSVLGVSCRENRQLVIFDTPGVLPKLLSNKYQKELSVAAWDSAQGADIAVLIIDVVKNLGPAEYEMLHKTRELVEGNPDMKLILVLNKMDLCKPTSKAHTLADLVREHCAPFARTFYTSFANDKGVHELTDALYGATHPGEWEYPSSTHTDQSQVDLVNEIVREKIFHRVHQEIPYRVRITNTGWTHLDAETMRIDILLEVDTRQQKLILTGHNESMLRYLVQRALPEVQAIVGKKVHLFLKCTVPTTLR